MSHTFASAGAFVTTLTVDDGRGGSDSSTLSRGTTAERTRLGHETLWSNELIGTESRETDVWTASSELFTASGGSVSIWIEATSPNLEPFRISGTR